jgi:sigma-B regulation protein RsbU (phosphoserine phosphatase)
MSSDRPPLPDVEILFSGAPCGLVVTEQNGTIVRANLTFCTWIGMTENALLGRRFQSLLTMGGRIFHQTHWAPLMQMQGSVAEVKLDVLHHDRRIITMLLNGVRREHAGGCFHELALFTTTDRDMYERELLNARKVAEQLLAEKSEAENALREAQEKLRAAYLKAQQRATFAEQMVAIVSHDLKNPLTAIKMATQMLSRSERPPRETTLLGHIGQSTDRAERMISDLLDLALVRVGRGLAVNRAPADLQQLARQSVEELQVAFPAATWVHQASGEAVVMLDADRLQQAIGNLASNAVAYGDTSLPITVSCHIEEESVLLSVHNHGAPIPESASSALFEPMVRGVSESGDLRSIGLGLFIVREIVAAHGGTVSLESTADTGTVFSLKLPRH